jgi:hypothetical protein
MRIMKLAVGLATGYVLGARAGREKYDQIAIAARKVSGHPRMAQTTGGLESSAEHTESVTAPAVVNTIEQPTQDGAGTKPRRSRNRRAKTTATTATPSASGQAQTMSTADLSLDALPLEAAEADVVEQHMPAVDNSEEPATTPSPLESNAADVQEQRRSL